MKGLMTPNTEDITSDTILYELGPLLVADVIKEIFQEWIHYSQPCKTSRLSLPVDDETLTEWQCKYDFIMKWFENHGIEKCKCMWCSDTVDDTKVQRYSNARFSIGPDGKYRPSYDNER